MCGIAGFYGFKNDKLIKQFSKDLSHRGPDGDGFYIDEDVSLMNRRLAIIDRKGGDQPIFNEDKSAAVVYNGEIYNFQDLRKKLEAKGHKFKTNSDTEIIVHSYEEKGEKCFEDFNGMFAIALYDIKKKKLILARDQFGIKPLYYSLIANKFRDPSASSKPCLLFSSEIKPLLNTKLFEKKVNGKILYRYLRYRIHDDNQDTFFDGIKRLLPGEILTITNNAVPAGRQDLRITNYFHTNEILRYAQDDKRKNDEIIQEFKEKLVEAVRLRLISEVPVGTSFSGGLDSSAVVAIVNQLLKEKVKETESVGKNQKTFSAVFPGSSNDEEKYVDAVIEKIGSKHLEVHKIKPLANNFFEDLNDFVRTQEEPTISTGPYAQYCVMKEAHKHITVLLDGQGSDEMMAGYLPYYFVYLRELLAKKNYRILMSEIFSSRDVISKFVFIKLKSKLGLDQTIQVNTLLNEDFVQVNKSQFLIENNHLRARLKEDIFKNSLQSLLRYEDRNTMRFSIEGRVPFLDINLLTYIWSLPTSFIIRNGWNKYILRKALKGLLPDLIVERRNKIGFTTPEYQWFLEKNQEITKIFESNSFKNRPYFNQEEVLKKWQDFVNKKNTDTLLFWRLINVEIWLREFID